MIDQPIVDIEYLTLNLILNHVGSEIDMVFSYG